MHPIQVVCGIVRQGNKVFVARRKAGKSMAGFWEFPGGKIEAFETPQQALERELQEELGMLVNVGEYVCTNIHHYEKISVELIAYQATFISSTYTLTDHDAYEWKELHELTHFNWAPADVPIFEKIKTI